MIDGRQYKMGHTKEYIQVAVETTENLANQIINGMITGFLTEDILLLKFSDR